MERKGNETIVEIERHTYNGMFIQKFKYWIAKFAVDDLLVLNVNCVEEINKLCKLYRYIIYKIIIQIVPGINYDAGCPIFELLFTLGFELNR